MKTSHINLILCLLAIGILIGGYYLLYQPEKDKEARLTTEINELQARYDELKAMEAHRDEYIAETENLKKQFMAELAKYAPDLDQENTVMYLKGTEEMFENFDNLSVGLPQPSSFYVLGSAKDNSSGDIVSNDGAASNGDTVYTCISADYPINFTGKYEEVKDYLDYVAGYKYRMNIKSITLTYNPEKDICNGTLTLGGYAITSDDRQHDVPSVNQPTGVENLFIGGNGAPAADVSPYSEDNGEAIVGTHNVVFLLNNASNDAASGIIIAANENDEATYVTSEANEIADVKVTVYTDAGKNFIKYEIGSKSYETEVLTDNVAIYVKSSDRVDSDDKNGVNVTIDNTSSVGVYVKVVDDSTAGRFSISSKSGIVKVYQ
jgi:hypothetical protein